MKVTCLRNNLFQGLGVVSHSGSKHTQLPILNNVLIRAKDGAIRLTTTNLELAVSCLVRGKIDLEGECTIPSKLFHDYVGLLPNEKVELTTSDDSLTIEAETYKTTLRGLPAAEYPLIPSVQGNQEYTVGVTAFREAISQVLFSASTNESRPELAGVLFHVEGSNVILAATDSYRLSERVVLVRGTSQAHRVIFPSKTIGEIGRILSALRDDVDAPNEITLRFSENQVSCQIGSTEIVSRLVEGTYPDYRQIIPSAFVTEAVVDRDEFMKAVKTASLFSKTGLFDVVLTLDPGQGLSVQASDSDRGENLTRVSGEVTGTTNSVTINYRYLLDGLQALSSASVRFSMIDGQNPCLVTPTNDSTTFRYIVMPIRA